MAQISNAGPFDIGPQDPLDPDAQQTLRFEHVRAGPQNKRGYLQKLYGNRSGLDYVFVVNASGEPIRVKTRNGQTLVPSATSQSLDSGGYRSVTVENIGGSTINQDGSDEVAVEVGNGDRSGDQQRAGFSLTQAAEDVIPGFSTGGQ